MEPTWLWSEACDAQQAQGEVCNVESESQGLGQADRVGGGAVGGEHAGPVLTPGPATTYSRAQDSVVLWPLKRLLLFWCLDPWDSVTEQAGSLWAGTTSLSLSQHWWAVSAWSLLGRWASFPKQPPSLAPTVVSLPELCPEGREQSPVPGMNRSNLSQCLA